MPQSGGVRIFYNVLSRLQDRRRPKKDRAVISFFYLNMHRVSGGMPKSFLATAFECFSLGIQAPDIDSS